MQNAVHYRFRNGASAKQRKPETNENVRAFKRDIKIQYVDGTHTIVFEKTFFKL